jgi:uncharacterized damage-inducible protein DinB
MTSTDEQAAPAADERTDLLGELAASRGFLRYTVRDLTDEQAGLRTTASALCLGGLIKHVAQVEQTWCRFLVEGTGAFSFSEEFYAERERAFHMQDGETLAGVLDAYEAVARQTEEAVMSLPDLGISYTLPPAPWFEPGARWTARRALVHIIAETTHHAGHADIIRESLDGAKTMG